MDQFQSALAGVIIPHALAAGLAGTTGFAAGTSSYGAQIGVTLVDTVRITVKALTDPKLVGALGGALIVTAGVLLATGTVLLVSNYAARKAAPSVRRFYAAGFAAIHRAAHVSPPVPDASSTGVAPA